MGWRERWGKQYWAQLLHFLPLSEILTIRCLSRDFDEYLSNQYVSTHVGLCAISLKVLFKVSWSLRLLLRSTPAIKSLTLEEEDSASSEGLWEVFVLMCQLGMPALEQCRMAFPFVRFERPVSAVCALPSLRRLSICGPIYLDSNHEKFELDAPKLETLAMSRRFLGIVQHPLLTPEIRAEAEGNLQADFIIVSDRLADKKWLGLRWYKGDQVVQRMGQQDESFTEEVGSAE